MTEVWPSIPETAPLGVGFATTHWSLVLAAGGSTSPTTAEALAALCQAYWFPLYAHIRRRGHNAESARDLTQDLFADLLARGAIGRAQEDKGRFRSFLMKAADNHLHRTHRNSQTQKRGGGAEIVSFDTAQAEEMLSQDPEGNRPPDAEYDRRWALATLERTRQRLRSEFAACGRIELFDLLRPHLFGDADTLPYEEISRQTGMSVGAIKQTTFRLRRRFGELLRVEVAETLARPDDVEEELRHLLHALG
jgi:RNA polymerase sigma-70 factor (ECF subfamily)